MALSRKRSVSKKTSRRKSVSKKTLGSKKKTSRKSVTKKTLRSKKKTSRKSVTKKTLRSKKKTSRKQKGGYFKTQNSRFFLRKCNEGEKCLNFYNDIFISKGESKGLPCKSNRDKDTYYIDCYMEKMDPQGFFSKNNWYPRFITFNLKNKILSWSYLPDKPKSEKIIEGCQRKDSMEVEKIKLIGDVNRNSDTRSIQITGKDKKIREFRPISYGKNKDPRTPFFTFWRILGENLYLDQKEMLEETIEDFNQSEKNNWNIILKNNRNIKISSPLSPPNNSLSVVPVQEKTSVVIGQNSNLNGQKSLVPVNGQKSLVPVNGQKLNRQNSLVPVNGQKLKRPNSLVPVSGLVPQNTKNLKNTGGDFRSYLIGKKMQNNDLNLVEGFIKELNGASSCENAKKIYKEAFLTYHPNKKTNNKEKANATKEFQVIIDIINKHKEYCKKVTTNNSQITNVNRQIKNSIPQINSGIPQIKNVNRQITNGTLQITNGIP